MLGPLESFLWPHMQMDYDSTEVPLVTDIINLKSYKRFIHQCYSSVKMRENKNHTKAFRIGTIIVSFWSSAYIDAKQHMMSRE